MSMPMNRRFPCAILLCWISLLAVDAAAAVRAWVSPDRIQLGQTTTLSVETDQDVNQAPDLSALQGSFNVLGQTSSAQTSVTNAGIVSRTTFIFELEAKQVGVLGIPALTVGGEQTEALSVTVLPAAVGSAANGDLIYLETEFDSDSPHVQQAVRYTVRLYYAVPLINGGVDAPAPQNAALQTLGEERTFQQQLAGRNYNVFERSYLLVPERSGPLTVPAPVFRGRARSANVDPFFDRGQNVSASGQQRVLEVRPQPATAPNPWLIASSARFTRAEVPQQGKVGEPLMLELNLEVEGITSTQLPELNLPSIAGAQVFPEPPQASDGLAQGQLRAQLRRRFAIVPNAEGALVIPELRVAYWNSQTDQLDAAVLPQLDLNIAAGSAQPLAAPGAQPVGAGAPAMSTDGPLSSVAAADLWPWQTAVALLSAALMTALWWGWSRGRGLAAVTAAPKAGAMPAQQRLERALRDGDLRQISLVLAQSPPSILQPKLDLVNELQRGLWSSGASRLDEQDLLRRLREAFKTSRSPGSSGDDSAAVLAELYPRRG